MRPTVNGPPREQEIMDKKHMQKRKDDLTSNGRPSYS